MAKRIPPLSPARVAAMRPPGFGRIELIDGATPGLRVRMGTTGERTWTLFIREPNGERTRHILGHDLGLSEARAKARALRPLIDTGNAPPKRREVRKQAVAERAVVLAQESLTFEILIEEYGDAPSSRQTKLRNREMR